MIHSNTLPHRAHYYLIKGWELIRRKDLRHFVIVPLLANIVVMLAFAFTLYRLFSSILTTSLTYLPNWLHWLQYIITILAIFIILFLFCYLFSAITNFIAAPFNSFLSEKVEKLLKEHYSIQEPVTEKTYHSATMSIINDLPRTLKREWHKIVYFLWRAIPILLCHFIPIIGQTLVPIMWFLLGCWMCYIEYADYPHDNHKIPFKQALSSLKHDKWTGFQFGLWVNILQLIPIVNLVIMPVAVCGGTLLWFERSYYKTIIDIKGQSSVKQLGIR